MSWFRWQVNRVGGFYFYTKLLDEAHQKDVSLPPKFGANIDEMTLFNHFIQKNNHSSYALLRSTSTKLFLIKLSLILGLYSMKLSFLTMQQTNHPFSTGNSLWGMCVKLVLMQYFLWLTFYFCKPFFIYDPFHITQVDITQIADAVAFIFIKFKTVPFNGQ